MNVDIKFIHEFRSLQSELNIKSREFVQSMKAGKSPVTLHEIYEEIKTIYRKLNTLSELHKIH